NGAGDLAKQPKAPPTDKNTPLGILSLTGGGIRGVVTAVWTEQLEARLGGSITSHVELLARTSTGSILACASTLDKSGAQLVDFYRNRGQRPPPSADSTH